MISLRILAPLLLHIGSVKSNYDPDSNKFHLPPLNINPDTITVAGFSSGAFMANQLFVILSETFAGASLMSGGAYTTALHWDELKGLS